MNNCPKCGNPLQPGMTSCPICGTSSTQADSSSVSVNNIANPAVPQAPAAPAAPVVPQAPVVAQTAPVAPAPVAPAPVEVAPVVAAPEALSVEVPAAAPVEELVPQAAPVVEELAPVAPAAPVAPQAPAPVEIAPAVSMPVPEAPIAPVVPQAPVAPEVQPAAVAPAVPVQPEVPVAAPVTPAMPEMPAIPTPAIDAMAANITSINTSAPIPNTPAPSVSVATAEVKPTKAKKGFNKNILIVAGAIAVIAIVALVAVNATKGMGGSNTPAPEEEVAQTNQDTINGFTFTLKDGWTAIDNNGSSVMIFNKLETIYLYLNVLNDSFDNLNEDNVKVYLTKKPGYSSIEVNKNTIGGKNAIIVDAIYEDSTYAQFFFIDKGNKSIYDVAVLYTSKETKEKYESEITNILGTISYSDEDTVKAIGVIDLYRDIMTMPYSIYYNSNDVVTADEETDNIQDVEDEYMSN